MELSKEELNEKIQAALGAFQALFSDDKTRKSKERWKDYFLSEMFLEVQFSEIGRASWRERVCQ